MEQTKLHEEKYDVIIIGGGPGGLTAGLYTARANFKTLLVESGAVMSQITVTHLVENYPGVPDIGGYELVEKFKEQAKKFGLATTSASVTSLEKAQVAGMPGWRVKTDAGDFETLAVIVATGANWRKIGVPGETEFTGRGVSYCATCDGPFYRDREVIVIGGGDTAVQEALFLTNFASKVTIVHRRDRLRATAILRERAALNPKIAFAWDSVMKEIGGKDSVTHVTVANVKDPGETRDIPAAGVFVFIGLVPNTGFLQGVIKLDREGYVAADRDMKTSEPGIFACGDCIEKLLRQVVTACGDGATAAFSAQLYVEELKGEAYAGR
ncbi:MAG TPA: thioredoxin-disulfide reductase [Syntrophales bacterium]|nr:thioredoxin-disulfide reductase [Syntrophales bacterium]